MDPIALRSGLAQSIVVMDGQGSLSKSPYLVDRLLRGFLYELLGGVELGLGNA